jgi:spore coat polysaccharide biosynthesis protein SpsF
LLSPSVVRAVVGQAAGRRDPVDLVSTTLTRTLPKGLNVELVRIATLRRLHETASATQREHVTAALHEIRNELRVISMELEGPPLSHVDLCVDTVDDLHRLEATSTAALAAYVDLVPVPR